MPGPAENRTLSRDGRRSESGFISLTSLPYRIPARDAIVNEAATPDPTGERDEAELEGKPLFAAVRPTG